MVRSLLPFSIGAFLVWVASSCLASTISVAPPNERPYRAKVVRARWVEVGDYQYFVIDGRAQKAMFTRDYGRTVQLLFRVSNKQPAGVATSEPEGYVFWFTTWFDESGRVAGGKISRSVDDGAMMVSGDIRVQLSNEASNAKSPDTTRLEWERAVAEHDSSMASPFLAPLWLEKEPALVAWQRDLEVATSRTNPGE